MTSLLCVLCPQKMQSLNIIVKLALLDGSPAIKYLVDMQVSEKEIEMYQKVMPRMKQLLHISGYSNKIFADTYFVSNINQAMCFEDLSVSGYGMVQHLNGFDMMHAKMVLSKLAKFHAAGAVMQEQQSDVFKNFKLGILCRFDSSHTLFSIITVYSLLLGMMNRCNDGLNPIYITQLQALIDTVSSWTDYEYYADKLRQLQPHLIEKGRCAFDAQPGHFNTLIHGDIWRNNVMLRYNEANQLENVALIDFQFCCWTSPAIDLQYFFNTSLEEDLRLHSQHELIQYYHKKLSTALKRLNYRQHVPTLHEFQIQFMEKSFYGRCELCVAAYRRSISSLRVLLCNVHLMCNFMCVCVCV